MKKIIFMLIIIFSYNAFANNLLLKEKDIKFIYALFNDNNYSVALNEINKFIKKYPDAPENNELRYMYVECLFFLNNYKDVISSVDKILALYPEFPYKWELLFRKAQAYFYLDNSKEAIVLFKNVIKNRQDFVIVYYWMGVTYYKINDYKNSLKYLELYLASDNKDFEDFAFFTISKIYQDKRDFTQSNQFIKKLISKYPHSSLLSKSYNVLLENYISQKNYDKVIVLSKNVANNYKDDYFYYLVGLAYLYKKEYNSSIKEFQKILSNFPSSDYIDDVYAKTLQIYYINKNYDKAINLYNNLMNKKIRVNEEFLYWYSLVLLQKDDFDSVNKILSDLNEDFKERVLYEEAIILYKKGDYKEVVKLLENRNFRILKIKKSIYKVLADSYFNLNNYEIALNYYDLFYKSSSLDEEKVEALFLSGICLYNLKQYNKSYLKFKKLIDNYSDDKEYYSLSVVYILKSYINLGYYKKGSNFINIVKEDNINVDNRFYYYYYSGVIFFKIYDFVNAIEFFNKGLTYTKKQEYKYNILYYIAASYLNLKEYRKSLVYFEQAFEYATNDKEKVDVLFQKSQAYLKLKEYDTAYENFMKIVSDYPNFDLSDKAYFNAANSLFLKEDYLGCISLLVDFHDKYPQSELYKKVLFKLADSYYNLKNYDKAVDIYVKILELDIDKTDVDPVINGIVWSILNKQNEKFAISKIDELISQARSNNAIAYLTLAKVHIMQEFGNDLNYDSLYQNILVKYPEFTEKILPDYISFLVSEDNQLKAMEILNKYLNTIQDSSVKNNLKLELAKLKISNKDFSGALELVNQFQEADSLYYYQSLILKSKIEYQLGNITMADSLLKFVELKSPIEYYKQIAQAERGILYFNIKKYTEAEQIFQGLIASYSDETAAKAQFYLGEIFFVKSDYKTALGNYLKVKYLYSKFTQWVEKAMFKAALCDIKLNNLMQAKEKLLDLSKNASDSLIREQAKKELDKID